jgi:single-strand DNA-binding protein
MDMGNVPQRQKHCNEVHLAGVLARDPETRKTASGKLVANVTVATKYETRTEFHKCVFWEEQAARLSDAFHKGDFISLHGRLQTRSWETDGTKRYTTEVVVWNFSSDGDANPADKPAPLSLAKGGVAAARAILAPSKTTAKNAHGVDTSDDDLSF